MPRTDKPAELAPKGQPDYLGSTIRKKRQAIGLSVGEMAQRIDYHPGTLSKVENNVAKPSFEMLSKIAEILGEDPSDLEQAPLHPRILAQQKAAKRSRPVIHLPESVDAFAQDELVSKSDLEHKATDTADLVSAIRALDERLDRRLSEIAQDLRAIAQVLAAQHAANESHGRRPRAPARPRRQ